MDEFNNAGKIDNAEMIGIEPVECLGKGQSAKWLREPVK
jgi:hypothetical protein